MDTGDIVIDEEGLGRKHKQEKKELQYKIQSLKKSVPKGDKKKKKEITEEIAKLEIELDEKHKKEINQLNPKVEEEVQEESDSEDLNQSNNTEIIDTSDNELKPNTRVSRAQKRRNKKENDAKERENRIAEQAEKNREGPRNIELNSIKQVLKSMNLKLYNIPADGNCLYLAINHQLQVSGRPAHSVSELRKVTSDFMRKHKDDFMPFMCNELDESEVVSEEQFESYCKDVASTKLWGGQLELRAMSNILKCRIKIIQATGPPTLQGEAYKGPDLVLTYHRHLYRLGEHYNSTVPVSSDEDI